MIGHRIRTVAVLTLASSLLACGVPEDRRASTIPVEDLPAGLQQSPETTVPIPIVEQEPIDVWLVREGVLIASRHRVDPPVTVSRAVDELLGGPTQAEQNRSLRSAIPDAEVVLSATVAGGVATVELAPEFSDIPASDQLLAVAQIVLTLTDLRGVGGVRFVVDESQVAVPLPTGASSDGTVSRDDFIVLTQPRDAETADA